MVLDHEDCYRALVAHDARFDGVFFVGVSSTGIYCRPVCPAKIPRMDRCRFFGTAAAAEREGLRPCLRCRPEIAPGRSSVDAVAWWAAAAVRRIKDGALMDTSLDDLAGELGISGRHLRRAVRKQYGVTPVELVQTQRLLNAKRLLTDTAMPIGEVAAVSGFGSLRRLNALFQERYRLTPSDLRRSRRGPVDGSDIVCELPFRPPFDWHSILGFLGARASAGVEAADSSGYRRTVVVRKGCGWLKVEPVAMRDSLRVTMSHSLVATLPEVLVRVRRLFDLDAEPSVIAERLGPLVAARPGLRVPGAFDGFEPAWRAILGQQVSVKGARACAGRFAQTFGEAIETPYPELNRLSPTAERVAALDPQEIASNGIIRSRADAIVALARAVASREIVLVPGVDVLETKRKLCELPGVGEWTAEYIAMRCLSWPDAFPATDLAVKKALSAMPHADPDSWRPWRAYATMHLWKSLEVSV